MKIIDVTTTSVGRMLIKNTYESFFKYAKFSGKYFFHITIDPSYDVTKEEISNVIEYLYSIKKYECVYDIEITLFDKSIGLEGSLMVLFSQCIYEYGINLEDDWEFFNEFDVDSLINDLSSINSCMIAFSNTHLEKRNTFLKESGLKKVFVNNREYIQLIPPNWACDYIPLAPNIHNNHIWCSTYVKGLVSDWNRERCPDERTKEYVRSKNIREKLNVLWTKNIVVKDTGREWLANNNKSKKIYPSKFLKTIPEFKINANCFNGYKRSEYLYNRSIQTIPGQTQTYMKRGGQHYKKQPLYADKGWGCKFMDVDGNVFIDYVAGLGVLQLGYCHPAFNEAILSHLNKGVYFSLPTWHEIEASELLKNVIPNAEMSRFLKSGGDACSAAITLAKYITKRQGILSCGYHGWHEQFQPSQPGAFCEFKHYIKEFDFEKDNIEEIIKKNADFFACVIIAFPYENCISSNKINQIRKMCDKYEILLILDDVVTGFRLALGGAQEYFNFDADIIISSKALTAGAELASVSGKSKYMKEFENLFVSTTMGGELTALQCMINAVNIYKSTNLIKKTHILGCYLREKINVISNHYLNRDIIFGYESIIFLKMNNVLYDSEILEQLCKNGIYMKAGCNFITGAHKKEDIDYTINVFEKIICSNKGKWIS